jgi:hypothetical protein
MRLSLVLLSWFVCAMLPAAELTTLKGQKLTGDVVAISNREVTLRTDDRSVVVPIAELLTIRWSDPATATLPQQYVDIELVDGTLFHASGVSIKGKTVLIILRDGRDLAVDLAKVASILNQAHDPIVRKAFESVAGERTRSDRFFIRRESRLDGLEGTFGEATPDGRFIAFTSKDGEVRRLPLDRLTGLLFNNRLEGNVPPSLCRLIDRQGNRLNLQKFVWSEGKAALTTVSGVSIELSSLETIALLDYSKDKIVYLSDLKPAVEERDFEDLPLVVARDTNLDSQPIQLEGRVYSRGLTLHPPIALTYDLNGEYKQLQAIVGVDSSVQTPSHVRLFIEGDGRPLLQIEVKVKEAPKPINLDIRKVRQLTIRAVPTEGLPFGHQITLAEARITK